VLRAPVGAVERLLQPPPLVGREDGHPEPRPHLSPGLPVLGFDWGRRGRS
jgi:hypothetical protein